MSDNIATITAFATIGDNTFKLVSTRVVGFDDRVYESNRDIWDSVPRGFTDVYIGDTLIHSVRGMKKFGYFHNTCYGDRSRVVAAFAAEKENGENIQVAAFVLNDIPHWIVGSKHVHIIFRHAHAAADIATYVESRFTYAVKNALLFTSCCGMTLDFNHFLSDTRFTAIGEAIFSDSQHIVKYSSSEIRFFALVNPTTATTQLVVNPLDAHTIFRSLGLITAPMTPAIALHSHEYDACITGIRSAVNSEGAVMYGIDSDGCVCFIWKEKSVNYVLERAAREIILSGCSSAAIEGVLRAKVAELFAADELPLVDRWFAERIHKLASFNTWLRKTYSFDNRWALQSQWLSLQDAMPDDVVTDEHAKHIIMMSGPPGSGKSTLARAAFIYLKGVAGMKPCWINQDECGGNRKAYIGAIKSAMLADYSHIILDKSNLAPENRKDYIAAGCIPNLAVVMEHPAGDSAMLDVCRARISVRGKGHRSLHNDAPVSDILAKMMASATSVSAAEASGRILRLNVLASPEENLAHILAAVNCRMDESAECIRAIVGAVSAARDYEKIAGAKKILYWCISCSHAERARLLDAITAAAPDALAGKTVGAEFHYTLQFYSGGVCDPETDVRLMHAIGSHVDMHVKEIVWNDKGAACRIVCDIPTVNKHPHITIACATGVKPVYSNELFDVDGTFRVPLDITISGSVAHK